MNRRRFLKGSAATLTSVYGMPALANNVHGASVSTSNFHYFKGSNLHNWQNAMALQKAGTRNAKVLCVGDSTTFGVSGASLTNKVLSAYPAQLATLMNRANPFPVTSVNSWFGDGNVNISGSFTSAQWDARISLGSWVNTQNGTNTMGGPMIKATSASGGALGYTPNNSVDSFDVYTFTNNTSSSMTIQIDAGSTTSLSMNSANSIVKTTLTTTAGTHTLNCNWVSGTPFLGGVYGYNSAVKEISIVNAGVSGGIVGTTTGTGWTGQSTQPWYPISVIQAFAPDLTIINLCINDWNAGTNLTTWINAIGTLVTAAQASGDVILATANPCDPTQGGVASLATQQSFVTQLLSYGSSNNIPVVDIWNLFGANFTTPNGNGWMYNDLHPNVVGYGIIAGYFQQALTPGFISLT